MAEHDGYRRLGRAATHTRRLVLRADARELIVEDLIESADGHDAEICFHFAPEWHLDAPDGRSGVRLRDGERTLTVTVEASLRIVVLRGSEAPVLGWRSLGYHRLEPCVTMAASGRMHPGIPVVSTLRW